MIKPWLNCVTHPRFYRLHAIPNGDKKIEDVSLSIRKYETGFRNYRVNDSLRYPTEPPMDTIHKLGAIEY